MSEGALYGDRLTVESKITQPFSSSKPRSREEDNKDLGLSLGAEKISEGPPGREVIFLSRKVSLSSKSDSEEKGLPETGMRGSVRRFSFQEWSKGAKSQFTGSCGGLRGPNLAAAQFWRAIEIDKGKNEGKRGMQKSAEDGKFRSPGSALGLCLGTSLEGSSDPEGVRRAAGGSPRKRDEGKKYGGALKLSVSNGCGMEETQQGQVPSGGSRERVSVKQTIRSFESILKPGLVGRRASQFEPSKRFAAELSVLRSGKDRPRSLSVPSLLRQPSTQQGQANKEDLPLTRGRVVLTGWTSSRVNMEDGSSMRHQRGHDITGFEPQDGPGCVARQHKPESPCLGRIGGMSDGGNVSEGAGGASVCAVSPSAQAPTQGDGQLGNSGQDLTLSTRPCLSTPMSEGANATRKDGGRCLLPAMAKTTSEGIPSLVVFPVESSPLVSWAGLDRSLETAAILPCLNLDDEWSESDESEMTTHSDGSQLDRSYSISLAELRDCGPGWREDSRKADMLDRSASLQSNASFLSFVSLIPSDELDLLMEEVKGLDDGGFESLDDIRVVVLHKEEGAGLGFSIAGGEDCETKRVTVHKVFVSGLAAQEGTIQRGDEVLSINGSRMQAVAHSEALASLHKARSLRQAIVVVRRASEAALSPAHSTLTGLSEGSDPVGKTVTMELTKGSSGLGFSLNGGRGSSQGDKPLTVKKVFQGGLAASSGLIQTGDQVMEIQGVTMQDLTCYEAWNLIKSLPTGPVSVRIRKKVEQPGPTT
ncbi:pro-interleukin-16-like [Callorhinchus milii]|uniref:pro-interleukin-16-like n=1 Tax=Callorhinchus milii TaxID=7868 RepID=UPI001C3FBB82|nr:pro-interleukin-16-like [Callorhinchus milii]